MPSDLAKKRAAKKKEAAKARQRTKKADEVNDGDSELEQQNEAENNGERRVDIRMRNTSTDWVVELWCLSASVIGCTIDASYH